MQSSNQSDQAMSDSNIENPIQNLQFQASNQTMTSNISSEGPGAVEEQKSLVTYLIDLSKEIQKNIDRKYEPIEQLKEINQLLNNEFQQIWSLLLQEEPQRKLEFYKSVFKSTTDKMLAEKLLSQPDYLPQILKFFRNILVNYFPNDPFEESLGEIVHSLFNLDASLYTSALQGSSRKNMNQQQEFNPLNQEEASDNMDIPFEHQRIKNELEWRNQLKIGDRVDCINTKLIQQHKISHWAPGTISQQLEFDQFYVTFDNEHILQNKIVKRYGAEIAFPGTYTDDFSWRYEIKPGDTFDCIDSEGMWYKSTCMSERKMATNDGREQKEIYVGYRIYDEEEGHKTDEVDGRKFIGWSNKYDEWMTITSPQVQRYGTMTKWYKIAGKATMQYDNVVEDLVDTMQNTTKRKVWTVYRNNFFSNLRCIPDYLNEFGERDGFEKILDFFITSPGKRKVTLRHLYYLMDFLSKTCPIWHRQFACYYIPRLKEAFTHIVLYTNPENTGPIQMKFNRESLNGIQKSFQNVLKRYFTADQYGIIMAEMLFNIGFSLMKSEKLEQRIQGLKEIVEQIKGNKYSVKKTLNVKDVIRKLKEENIFEMIFGENYHIQLIQRSQEIIRYFINEKEIGEKEIDLLWNATKKDQSTKMEIYKIISEIAIMFKNDEIELLVERFAQVPPEQFVEKEIECVYELSKYSYKQAKFSVRAANLFWDIAVQERPYKKQIIEMALDKFIELIRNWERDQKGEFVYKCIEKIQQNQASIQCIKIMQKILDQIPTYRINNQHTIYETAISLIKDYQIIDLIIMDLSQYTEIANNLWSKNIINSENIETQEVIDLPFSHRTQVHARINFIRQMLNFAQAQIEQYQLDQIWDILMFRSKITIDSDIFFNWLKLLINDQNKLSYQLTQHFFQTKVCGPDVSFKTLRKAGFECISNIFLNINEQEDKLVIIFIPTQQNPNNKLEFRLHVPPREVIGIEVIWKLLQECDKKNLDLTALVIDLVTKIYHSLSSTLEPQKYEIEDQFCQETLQRLVAVIKDPSITNEEKQSFTKMITVMLKSFFQDTEKNGTGCMKTHQSLDKQHFVECVVIQNNITQQKNTPKYVVVSTHSNMTIWELKKIVAEKTKQSPLRIQLGRSDQKKTVITDMDNMKMIRELKIENYELLYAQKKPIQYQNKVPLLNKKKELMPEARIIFESWFDRFSHDGFMTPDSCVDFIRNSTNDQTVTTSDSRIVRLFNEYDDNLEGRLSREQFLRFYKDRAQQKPDLVWSNLNQHGYGNDLRPLQNQYLQDDPLETKDPSKLPRYKLSCNIDTFNGLFDITKDLQPEAQELIWTFICQLRTNPYVYSKLLALNDIESLVSSELNPYNLLYSLQLLENFINEYQVKQPTEIKCYYNENQDYSNNFPALGEENKEKEPSSNMNLPAAPMSGAAIPLPPAPPVGSGNIPEPPTQIPFIGPSLSPGGSGSGTVSEQAKTKELLDSFNGQIIPEYYDDKLFTNEELQQLLGEHLSVDQLRMNWLYNFVSVGGFNILTQLMNNLYNNSQKLNPDQEIFKTKVEKECIHQIMKIMKILLMASFIGNSTSEELTIKFTRSFSNKESLNAVVSSADDEKKEDKKDESLSKSLLKVPQLDIAKLFQPLIDAFIGELGSQILGSIKFKEFQAELLSIIQLILRKKEKVTAEDRNIIEQGISLWISCIIFNADLLQYIYDDHNRVDMEKGTNQQSITNIIIEQGLLSQNLLVRNHFREALKFICTNVASPQLTEQPYIFFLRLLFNEIGLTEFKSKESKQYFQVLKVLMSQYFKAQQSNDPSFKAIFDQKELLIQYIDKLQNYQSKEKKGAYLEDTNLVGYIEIVHELIKYNPSILNADEYNLLLTELIEKCLFTFYNEPIPNHITKDVDIAAHERPYINKCQSTESRSVAYALITTICKSSPTFISQIMAKYWHPLLFRVKKPKKAGFQPRSEGRSFHGYCGIKNLGCICYMNAMIQQFYHIPAFRYGILAADDKQAPNWNQFEGESVDDNVLHQLMKFMGFLELSDRQDYNPREFCFSFKDFDGQPTNVRIQCDSQEFLNLAFDRLENLLANTSQRYLLKNVFGGQTTTMLICKSCRNVKRRQEDFYTLSLEVRNQKSIQEGLQKLISPDIINDFQCEACNQRVDVEKRTVLEKLPNMLIVHLTRIVFDFDTLMNQKLNSRVEFPNVLNLKPYMMGEVLKQEKELLKRTKKDQKKQQQKQKTADSNFQSMEDKKEDGKEEDEGETVMEINTKQEESPEKNVRLDSESDEEAETEQGEKMEIDDPEENYEYKLVGVILHMGTADAGHYLSYININRNSNSEESPEWLLTEKDKWLEFNDSLVKDYRFTNLEEDCFGGVQNSVSTSNDYKNDYSRNAYMLIYEKRHCDGTAISRAQQQQLDSILQENHLMYLSEQIREQVLVKKQVEYDEEKKEHFILIDFNAVEKFVPNNIYKQIHDDNHLFMTEKQIFNNGYFEVTQNLIKELIANSPQVFEKSDEFHQNLFQFMDRLVFDLLAMTTENKRLIDVATLYTQMLERNDEQLYSLIENRILVDKEKIDKDGKTFFESLISHMEKDVREMNQIILEFVVKRLFVLKNYELLDTIMNQIFALFPDDLCKNWLKIHQFLSFFFTVVQSGLEQMNYMINKGLIVKLIDFFLENDSPYVQPAKKRQVMGSNYATPPLEKLVLTLSFILRQHSYINLSGLPDDQLPLIHSPFFMNVFGQPVQPLSQEDLFMLSQKALINRGIRCMYEALEFSRMIGHLCFENYNTSLRVSKKIITAINKASSDESHTFLNVINNTLIICDSLMDFRFEWMLGIPQLKLIKPINYNPQTGLKEARIGVELLDSASESVIEYRSTAFKTQSSVKESLLEILYSYRKRWLKFSLQLLNSLMYCLRTDASGRLFKYLITMEPPSYIYARYLDWIRPYLVDQMEQAMRNINIKSYSLDYKDCFETLTYFDEIIKPHIPEVNLNNNPEPNQDVIQRFIQYDSERDGGPQPYVIWKILDERTLKEIFLEENIWIVQKELRVIAKESQPDCLNTNCCFLPNQFSKNSKYNVYQYNNNAQEYQQIGATNWGQNKQYGRGMRKGQVHQGVNSNRKRNQDSNKKQRQRPKRNQGQTSNDQDVGSQNQDDVNMDDIYDDKSVSGDSMEVENNQRDDPQEIQNDDQQYNGNEHNQANQQDGNNGCGGYFDGIDTTANQDQDLESGDNQRRALGIVPNVNQDQEINQDEINAHINDDNPYLKDQNPQNNQQDSEQMQQQQMPQFEEEGDPNLWEAPLEVVQVFVVQNRDQLKAQKVVFTFKNSTLPNQAPLNVKLPKSRLSVQIMGGKDKEALILTKLRPFEDWGNFDYDVYVEQPKQLENAGQNINAGAAIPIGSSGGNNVNFDTGDYPHQDIADEISCGACTFLNSSMLTTCEMCGSNLK